VTGQQRITIGLYHPTCVLPLAVALRGLPAGQAFTRFFLRRSILATPAEGAKMLVRPSSQRTRKRGGSSARPPR
jgi:hypothetical protein